LFAGKPVAAVATVISTESRNVRHTPLIPPHLPALQSAGIPVIGLRDETLTADQLRPFSVVTVETASCLPTEAASALAGWVRDGGTLIAVPTTGYFDELGRKRPESSLWKSLQLETLPTKPLTVGHGQVIVPEPAAFASEARRFAQPYSFLENTHGGVEVVAYRTAGSLLLHIIQHERTGRQVELHLPKMFTATSEAKMFTPGSDDQSLPVTVNDKTTTLALPNAPLYAVVQVFLK
jgi:hypothetical protein